MKRTNPGEPPDDRQRRLAEKYEWLSDYVRQALSDDPIDAMSADSFPASDPPTFTVVRRDRRNEQE